MREDEFIAQLSRRLGRQKPSDVPPARTLPSGGMLSTRQRPLGEQAALVEQFVDRLQSQGGAAHVYRTKAALAKGLSAVLDEMNPRLIGVSGEDFPMSCVTDVLASYETIVCEPLAQTGEDRLSREGRLQRLADADLALTGCLSAVADTGTMVLSHAGTHPRALSLLPMAHIVVLYASQIVGYLGEALELLMRREQLPANVLYMSGPSRSSDIENDLTIGVHGPAVVMALILMD